MAQIKRNNLFDLLRVLFTISVVVSHASGTVFHGEIVSANVAVDGFFMLSGFFMARHLYNRKNERAERVFLDYQIGRIRRLFPMYALSCLVGVFVELIFHHSFVVEKWAVLYFMGNINGIPGYPVIWYVAALFWAGLFVSAFLIWKRKISVLVIFPLTFFVLFSVMYSYHNLWLYSQPLLGGIFSAGLLKAVCALCVGAEVFYASRYLKARSSRFRPLARKTVALLCETIFIAGFLSSFWIWFSPKNFFVYLYVPLILLVFGMNEQVVFKILDRPLFSTLGKLTYAVYLTHLYFLQFLAKTNVCQGIPQIPAFVLIVIASFLIGYVFCKIEKIIRILFQYIDQNR